MILHPVRLKGNWDDGYALDEHVLSSVPKHDNENGYIEYGTVRTELGELVYQFKYRNKYDCLDEIIDMIIPFLDKWVPLAKVDTVIPVPPSKRRPYQPAAELAIAISEYLEVEYIEDLLKKTSSEQSKNMNKRSKKLSNSIIATQSLGKPSSVLLVDDLFCSGETIRECASVLRQDHNLNELYVLTMTRTR